MRLKITPEVRRFYKQLASEGGKARAKKYDHETLSEWAKLGGRPKKDANGGRRVERANRESRIEERQR